MTLRPSDERVVKGLFVDEEEDQLDVLIECFDDYEGVFQMNTNHDGEYYEVFSFSFTNRSNGMKVSQGKWVDENRGEKGLYQMIVTSVNTYVMEVFILNEQGNIIEVRSVTASKFIEREAQPWYQRWSMPLMLLVVVFVSQLLKQPQQSARSTQRRTRPAQPSRRSGPVIEEVTDDAPNDDADGENDKID